MTMKKIIWVVLMGMFWSGQFFESEDTPQRKTAAAVAVPGSILVSSLVSGRSSQFQEESSAVLKGLPSLAELKEQVRKNPHYTPPALIRAGMRLGKIAQAIRENPSLQSEGIAFYQDCVSKVDLPKSIRAVCFTDLKKLVSSVSVPDDLAELVRRFD